jgi:molecular chaperone GrpE
MLDDQLDKQTAEEIDEPVDGSGEELLVEEPVDDVVDELDQASAEQSALESLQSELDEALAKGDEYLDGWQRARAEFANYKKRVEREQAQIYQTTTGSIIKRYLDIIDDLDLALKNRPQEGDGASWANGIDLIYRKLYTILENEGVTPMQTEGEFFDPNLHEAITSEPNDDFESGQIIEVVKQGYLLGERVLRPAVVRVAQ